MLHPSSARPQKRWQTRRRLGIALIALGAALGGCRGPIECNLGTDCPSGLCVDQVCQPEGEGDFVGEIEAGVDDPPAAARPLVLRHGGLGWHTPARAATAVGRLAPTSATDRTAPGLRLRGRLAPR